MSELIPIPERLKKRPLFRGMPIPFSTFIKEDGQPDFKVINEHSVKQCATKGLCGICGQQIRFNFEPFCFIGGEKSIASRIFIDPPMHKECAEYSMSVCPFLNGSKGYSTAPPTKGVTIVEAVSKERSRRGILPCRGYSVVASKQGRFFKGLGPQSVIWQGTT